MEVRVYLLAFSNVDMEGDPDTEAFAAIHTQTDGKDGSIRPTKLIK